MNAELVDSIVQMIDSLPIEEKELVRKKVLSLLPSESVDCLRELTLEDRQNFLRKPLAERQVILAEQAQQMLSYYQCSTEWRELMAGDIIDD